MKDFFKIREELEELNLAYQSPERHPQFYRSDDGSIKKVAGAGERTYERGARDRRKVKKVMDTRTATRRDSEGDRSARKSDQDRKKNRRRGFQLHGTRTGLKAKPRKSDRDDVRRNNRTKNGLYRRSTNPGEVRGRLKSFPKI